MADGRSGSGGRSVRSGGRSGRSVDERRVNSRSSGFRGCSSFCLFFVKLFLDYGL